eukprot:774204-Amphidinium_carterae.2
MPKHRLSSLSSSGVLHCDVCGPFEEASDKGEKLLSCYSSSWLRVSNKDKKLVLLPHFVPLVHKRATEVTPAIVNLINRIVADTRVEAVPWLQRSSYKTSDVRLGIRFENTSLKIALTNMGVSLTYFQPYQPKSNGTSETTNREFHS